MLAYVDLAAWLALQVVSFRRTVKHKFFQRSGRAMVTANLLDDVVDVLGEAVVEIASLDGPANVVCGRLRSMQRRLKPFHTSVDELAKRIDVSPRDVLDGAIAAGAHLFWHQGETFHTPSDLLAYLTLEFLIDPVPELEFELTADQSERLATELGVEVEQLTTESAGSKTLRKFAASDQTPPGETADRRRQQTSSIKRTLAMSQTSNLEKLLMDAAVEIAVLDGTDNEMFRRLLAELQTHSQSSCAEESSDPASTKPPRKFAPSDSVSPTRAANEKKQSG